MAATDWGVGVIAITRRIQRISKDFFDLCQGCFFFKCGLKSREYIKDMTGVEISRMVTALPKYHFLYYSIETEYYEVSYLELKGRPHIEKGREEKPIVEEGKVDAEARR